MNRTFKPLVLFIFVGVCFSAKLKFRPLSDSADILTEVSVTDEHGTAEVFDGIGGISGGGATSKLLVNYPDKQRNEILDFLFKPDYAASLQILKVEIGGDSQSTDGSEASHMHEPDTENYHSGYEWWLMKEAKKRNPKIKLYGLSWVFPGWLNNGRDHPFGNYTALADYFLKWIKGAKIHHDLDIDYMGIWNERSVDKGFVKFFRKRLNKEGFAHIKVVVPDAMDWSIADRLIEDPEYLKAVDIIGQHYPNATSPAKAWNLGKKLWASEDFSSNNNLGGGGCWARVLNEGPVFGHYSAFIAWNLITSYYNDMPYGHCSLMTANEPWTGHYSVDSPIWSSAHHTFFYQPGWKYLPHGSGVGVLKGNGTFITLVSPDHSDVTMVISTMNPKQANCLYSMPQYEVASTQKATFQLKGNLKNIKKLNLWYSFYDYSHKEKSIFFEQYMPIKVVDGKFTLKLKKNAIITLTTVEKEKPDNYPGASPPSKRFPVPFYEDFEGMNLGEEPYNFSPQSGAYEVTMAEDPKHGKVMTQVVLRPPIDTCWTKMGVPPNLIGDFHWSDVKVKVDAFVDKKDKHAAKGVFLASNVNHGGCDLVIREGVYFWVNISKGVSELCLNHNCSVSVAVTKLPKNLYNTWFTMSLDVQGRHIKAMVDDDVIFNVIVENVYSKHGFVVLGPNNFGRASFDNFALTRALLSNDVVHTKSVPKYLNRL